MGSTGSEGRGSWGVRLSQTEEGLGSELLGLGEEET